MKYFVTLPSGREFQVELNETASGGVSVTVDGVAMPAEATEGTPPELGVIADGQRFFAKIESERMRIQAAAHPTGGGEGIVRSPMPGRVVRVLVTEGEELALGAPVAVVEAMKMENELFSAKAGKVKRVHVATGATVEGGAVLVEIE